MTSLPHTTLPAKTPTHVVAGPYGHPTHPVAVIVPIGAWVSSLALDLLARRSRGNMSKGCAGSSRALIGLGLLGAGGAPTEPALLRVSAAPAAELDVPPRVGSGPWESRERSSAP